MPMNPNFLCCIGAELKNSTQQTTRMSQIYLYRAFEDDTISDMLSAGFFNAALGIVRQDDLLLLYSPNETTAKYTYARVSSVSSSGVVITPIGIDASQISVDTTGFSNITGDNLQEVLQNIDSEFNKYVKKDGSSIMTGPLKFRAGSFEGAIAGGFGDGISVYKLKADGSIDSEVASITKDNGFTPGTTNTQDIGSSSLKWKDLYVVRVIAAVLNNGADISVPTTSGTMALTSDIKDSTISVQLDGSDVDSFTLNQSSNKTIDIPAANKDLSNLTATGEAKFTAKANTDMDNLTNKGANIGNWSSNVTNCITEIPQDINLTLSSGTLTLKAGSKAYLPDGTTYSASQDIVLDNSQFGTATNNWVLAMTANNAIFPRNLANCVSGAGATTIAGFAYDTTTNVISWYNAGGTVGGTNCSFPIAVFHTTNGTPDRITHIFNGFGWIGTRVFILPGVKALAPNGKNSDGTLKNTIVEISAIKTTDSYNCKYILNNAGISPASYTNYAEQEEQPSYTNGQWYQPSTNNFYTISSGVATKTASSLYAFEIFTAGSGVSAPTGIKIKQPFHAIDYNDMDLIAHQAMPSDKYIDLTLGTSGNNYTAPADGYVLLEGNTTNTNGYILLGGGNCEVTLSSHTYNSNSYISATIPVSKGMVYGVWYQNLTAGRFRFVYANGAK